MTKDAITTLLFNLQLPDKAKPAREAVINRLKRAGYKVTTNLPIETKSNSGRALYIEIIAVKGDEILAIEVDRRVPGSKALIKMQSLDDNYTKIILLRNANYGIRTIGKNLFVVGVNSYRL